MSDQSDRARLVEAAKRDIILGSRSFALASRLFDRATRERAWLLYAWCRAADDIVDGQTLGRERIAVEDPAAALALVRHLTGKALCGHPTGNDAFDALGLVVRECGLPHELVFDVIDGFVLDAEGFFPKNEKDLYRYCYHVAGAVGVMMALVMGVERARSDVLDRACDLGIAFQLANIARDLVEDATVGRCYVPENWLREEGLTRDSLLEVEQRPVLVRVAARLVAQVERYEGSARAGAALLPVRSAWAVLAAAGIYGGIAKKVARRGSGAWTTRTTTSIVAKLGWVLAGGVAALTRQAMITTADRVGLWNRPARP